MIGLHYAIVLFTLLGLLVMDCGIQTVAGDGAKKCEEITIPMCRGIGYNFTYMPNQFSHDSQEEAGLEVHQFWPLVEIQCSPDLKFFLCSMYTPICMPNYQKPLPACRSVCERAKAGCAPLMRQYGFAWPERMRCSDHPEDGDRHRLCMDFNRTGASAETTRLLPLVTASHGLNPPPRMGPSTARDCRCECRYPLLVITNHSSPYFNRVLTGGETNCAVPCDGAFFRDSEEKTFVQFWIGIWSVLCFVSTSLTILTFLVDMQRFRYPERAIIYLSVCYAFISLGYIVRLIVGHTAIACDEAGGGAVRGVRTFEGIAGGLRGIGVEEAARTIRYYTTGPFACTAVFLLVYFFGMASCIWWVVLSLTWFLAAGLKWSQEAIDNYAQYFHIAAWFIPSIKTIAILAMSGVDGDPVSGLCYVGNQDLNNLRGFVLAPLCLYLFVGTSFLVAGFVSLFRIRSVIKLQGQTRTDKLEKFMMRIGVVSVLYTVPATTVIGCYLYEQHYRDRWEQTLNCPCLAGTASGARPDYSVFMLKYFMCLVVGITSGFWIWTRKTLDAWCRCYGSACGSNSLRDKNLDKNQRPPRREQAPTSAALLDQAIYFKNQATAPHMNHDTCSVGTFSASHV